MAWADERGRPSKSSVVGAGRSFVQSSVALVSGTAVSQAIVFLCSPLLSRIYRPSDFGDLANFNAWVSILVLLSTLRYEHAVIVTKGGLSRTRVLALSLVLIAASVALFSALAGLIYASPGSDGYAAQLRGIVRFIPLGVFFGAIASLLNIVNARLGHFKTLAVLGVVQVVGTVALQLALGVLQVKNALVVGALAGSALACVAVVVMFLRTQRLRHMRSQMTARQLWRTAREHANFPRYTLAADAINIVQQQFVPVFLLAMYDPTVAGLYAFAVRVVRVPMFVISAAVSTVLRKHATEELLRHGNAARLFRVTVTGLSLIAVIPLLALLSSGQWLFALFFGEQWVRAGLVVQVLSPGIMLEFVALPLAVFFLVTNTQRYTLRIQLGGLALLLAALLVGGHGFEDFLITCGLLSLAMLLINLATIVLAWRVTRVTSAAPPVLANATP